MHLRSLVSILDIRTVFMSAGRGTPDTTHAHILKGTDSVIETILDTQMLSLLVSQKGECEPHASYANG